MSRSREPHAALAASIYCRGALRAVAAAAALGAGQVGAVELDIPIVSDAAWKSSSVLVSGWEQLGFDDSLWAAARAPYPSPSPPTDLIPGTTAQHIWHDPSGTSDGTTGPVIAFFRRSIAIDLASAPGPVRAGLRISVDDDYEIFVNGVLAFRNQDGGFATKVDSIDISPLIRNGTNVLAIRAVDNSLAAPADRLYERVLVSGRVQSDPGLILNGVPTTASEIPPLLAGDTLEARGDIDVPVTVAGGAKILGIGPMRFGATAGLSGGLIAGPGIELKPSASIFGRGDVAASFKGGIGSVIQAKGGVLKIGDDTKDDAFDHDGDIEVEAGSKLSIASRTGGTLGGIARMFGGGLEASRLSLKSGATITGRGEIGAPLKGGIGSVIQAKGGVLKIGDDTKDDAFDHDGDIEVEAGSKLSIASRTGGTLGGIARMFGGSLEASKLSLKSGAIITGHGAIDAPASGGIGSVIQAKGGVLKIGDASTAGAIELQGVARIDKGAVLALLARDAAKNRGLITLGGGVLQTVAGLEQDVAAKMNGSGSVKGRVVNKGEIAPGESIGRLDFDDELVLEATSLLAIEIAGRPADDAAVETFDRIAVAGRLLLAGRLAIDLLDDFEPIPGDSYDIAIADFIDGAFDSWEFPSPFGLSVVDLADGMMALRLTALTAAVPSPATGALLGTALALLVAGSRRATGRAHPATGRPPAR
ncbi:MAG: hypothetical protein JNK67_22580 [Alphaproteobacteria bacterium]|nr:hypothetical protein [Alphaproteobacteria bacterium]